MAGLATCGRESDLDTGSSSVTLSRIWANPLELPACGVAGESSAAGLVEVSTRSTSAFLSGVVPLTWEKTATAEPPVRNETAKAQTSSLRLDILSPPEPDRWLSSPHAFTCQTLAGISRAALQPLTRSRLRRLQLVQPHTREDGEAMSPHLAVNAGSVLLDCSRTQVECSGCLFV